MKLSVKISWIMGRMQHSLFPLLEEFCYQPLSNQETHLVEIMELISIEQHIKEKKNILDRPSVERKVIGRCFVAKSLFRCSSTRDLIHILHTSPNLRKICGFTTLNSIPSESTFSRVFKEFAELNIGNLVHDFMVEYYLSEELIGHVSRDSTAIIGREKNS